MIKKTIYFIIFLLILGSFYYYFFYNKDKATNITYEFTKIEKGDIKKIVSATGTIVPTSEIVLSSEISGKIANIYKDYNDTVIKNENLAIFDQTPFILKVKESQTAVDISNSILKQKKASLEKANAELANAESNRVGSLARIDDYKLYILNLKKNLLKQEQLFKKKFVSKKEFENSELDFNRSFFQLQNLQADLLSFDATIDSRISTIKIIEAEIEEIKILISQRKLTLESEKLDLSKTVITSPIKGFILDKHISVGDVLGSYQKDSIMFTIAESLANMNLEIFIDESDIGNIKLNQNVIFTTDAFPKQKIEASISQIRYTPIEEQNVITYQVIASFKNPDEILFPGMTANIDIIIDERKDVLKIKNAALNIKIKEGLTNPKKNKWGDNSDGQSQMREIMGKLNLTKEQQGEMRGIYPQLGKKKQELNGKGMSEEKISKQVSQFFESLFVKLLSDKQKSQFYSLKKLSAIKNVYQLINEKPQEIKLSVGLKAGGYTEILDGEVSEGDKFISKVIINKSTKKALRLF
jgi:HlyD family secretion protein